MLSDNTVNILKAFLIATADHQLTIEKQRQYLARLGGIEGKINLKSLLTIFRKTAIRIFRWRI